MVTQSLRQAVVAANHILSQKRKVEMEDELVNLLHMTSILSMVKISVLTPK